MQNIKCELPICKRPRRIQEWKLMKQNPEVSDKVSYVGL